MFDYSFWEKIRNIIKVFHLNYLYYLIGEEYLSKEEFKFLKNEMGKDKFKNKEIPLLDKIFILGKLSQQLGINDINEIDKVDFDKFVKKENIPNFKIKDNKVIDQLKKQAYLDVLGRQFTTEKEIRQIILNEENNNPSGKISIKNINKEIKEKFNDWSYIKPSVEYISESVFNEGRADEMIDNNNGDDPYVYIVSRPDCCKHCRRVYQVGGVPKIFKLSELQANGTNIGIKNPNNWKPTIPCLHPFCRCILIELKIPRGFTVDDFYWNGNRYVIKERMEDKYKEKIQRPKVKIQIGNKEYNV